MENLNQPSCNIVSTTCLVNETFDYNYVNIALKDLNPQRTFDNHTPVYKADSYIKINDFIYDIALYEKPMKKRLKIGEYYKNCDLIVWRSAQRIYYVYFRNNLIVSNN